MDHGGDEVVQRIEPLPAPGRLSDQVPGQHSHQEHRASRDLLTPDGVHRVLHPLLRLLALLGGRPLLQDPVGVPRRTNRLIHHYAVAAHEGDRRREDLTREDIEATGRDSAVSRRVALSLPSRSTCIPAPERLRASASPTPRAAPVATATRPAEDRREHSGPGARLSCRPSIPLASGRAAAGRAPGTTVRPGAYHRNRVGTRATGPGRIREPGSARRRPGRRGRLRDP